jgi:hypothetical protein
VSEASHQTKNGKTGKKRQKLAKTGKILNRIAITSCSNPAEDEKSPTGENDSWQITMVSHTEGLHQ